MKADSAPQFYFTLVSIAIIPGNEVRCVNCCTHISSENVQSCPRLLTSFASPGRRRMHEITGRYTKWYIRTTVHFWRSQQTNVWRGNKEWPFSAVKQLELKVDKDQKRKKWGERSSLRINENGRLILALMEGMFLGSQPEPVSYHLFSDSGTVA